MTFEQARELAQAIAQRNAAQTGLHNLLHVSAFDPPVAVKATLAALGDSYAQACRRIAEIIEEFP